MARGKKGTHRRHRMRGGWQRLHPASVDDTSMVGPSKLSGLQGDEYLNAHVNQHGGAASPLVIDAPVGDQGMLPDNMREAARVTPIDQSLSAIRGMSDQSGGSRRRSRRRSRNSRGRYTKKHGGARKNHCGGRRRRNTKKHGGRRNMRGGQPAPVDMPGTLLGGGRRRRKMRGGNMPMMVPASADAPGMILPDSQTVGGMNPEWNLAKSPMSFIPDSIRASVAAI